ncbi:hypothetical protein BJX66DRAFT_96433 [Aspergillus keveii]|uniref:Uncharacterized protein n=1 Tax=Aspergillus keveii TaxID=714993 RepID=A0ABR4FLH0_9EURO
MRLDPRITYQDIIDRVIPHLRPLISAEEIHRRRREFGRAFSVACWGPGMSDVEDFVRRTLVLSHIDPQTNSTRGLTPGLVNPRHGLSSRRIPTPAGFDTPGPHLAYIRGQIQTTNPQYGATFGIEVPDGWLLPSARDGSKAATIPPIEEIARGYLQDTSYASMQQQNKLNAFRPPIIVPNAPQTNNQQILPPIPVFLSDAQKIVALEVLGHCSTRTDAEAYSIIRTECHQRFHSF